MDLPPAIFHWQGDITVFSVVFFLTGIVIVPCSLWHVLYFIMRYCVAKCGNKFSYTQPFRLSSVPRLLWLLVPWMVICVKSYIQIRHSINLFLLTSTCTRCSVLSVMIIYIWRPKNFILRTISLFQSVCHFPCWPHSQWGFLELETLHFT